MVQNLFVLFFSVRIIYVIGDSPISNYSCSFGQT